MTRHRWAARVAFFNLIVILAACSGASPDAAVDTTRPVAMAPPDTATVNDIESKVVRSEMRNVRMHIEPGIALNIERLRATVHSTLSGKPPALNDKASMRLDIASAAITIDTVSLANLLNRHVFGYAKSPLRKLHVSIQGNEMVQTGSMKKGVWLPFRIRAVTSLTDSGEIRVHPTSVEVLGVGVKTLTRQLGGLGKMIKLEPGHGARIDGDDFLLNAEQMLPPPHIRGRLSSVRLIPSGIRQTFGPSDSSRATPIRRAGSTAQNYMYFHGGTLQFGKLTMRDTDLEIVDEDPRNTFDYSLDRYQEHLVAGHSNTTAADGLVVVMPDLQKLGAPRMKVAATPKRTTN